MLLVKAASCYNCGVVTLIRVDIPANYLDRDCWRCHTPNSLSVLGEFRLVRVGEMDALPEPKGFDP